MIPDFMRILNREKVSFSYSLFITPILYIISTQNHFCLLIFPRSLARLSAARPSHEDRYRERERERETETDKDKRSRSDTRGDETNDTSAKSASKEMQEGGAHLQTRDRLYK
jgi:hypothetical protein